MKHELSPTPGSRDLARQSLYDKSKGEVSDKWLSWEIKQAALLRSHLRRGGPGQPASDSYVVPQPRSTLPETNSSITAQLSTGGFHPAHRR